MSEFVTLTELASSLGETTAMVRGVAVGAKVPLKMVVRTLVVDAESGGRIAVLIHEHRVKHPQVRRQDVATSDAIEANAPSD